jgi:hypothetical protein
MKRIIYLGIALAASSGLMAGIIAPAASASAARPSAAVVGVQADKPALTPAQHAALQKWLTEAQIVLQLAQQFKTLLINFGNSIKESERNNDLVWLSEEIAALKADIREVQAELRAGVITVPSTPALPPPTSVNPGGGGCIAPPPFVCIT